MRGSIPRYKKADFLERPEMSRANWPSMYHFNSTFGSTLVRHVDSALELADGIAASAGLLRIEIHDYRGEERGKCRLTVMNEPVALRQLNGDGTC
jgi:hypothetical protein